MVVQSDTKNYHLSTCTIYRAFHEFVRAKFLDGGLVIGSSQFSILPKLPQKILLSSKVVEIDPKVIISLC